MPGHLRDTEVVDGETAVHEDDMLFALPMSSSIVMHPDAHDHALKV